MNNEAREEEQRSGRNDEVGGGAMKHEE